MKTSMWKNWRKQGMFGELVVVVKDKEALLQAGTQPAPAQTRADAGHQHKH